MAKTDTYYISEYSLLGYVTYSPKFTVIHTSKLQILCTNLPVFLSIISTAALHVVKKQCAN